MKIYRRADNQPDLEVLSLRLYLGVTITNEDIQSRLATHLFKCRLG